MNKYINLSRIEFVITNACTGRCRHCSVGTGVDAPVSFLQRDKALGIISELADLYSIESVMTFGGEPLLHAESVCAIHKMATDCGIPKRQVITNGFFTKDPERMAIVAKALGESGVNSLLLSVDAFHREHIPMDQVHVFAKMLCVQKIAGFTLHPAWVVNRKHENPFNLETDTCLQSFSDLDIPVSDGNDIFPSGNAAVYLFEYYDKKAFNLSARCGEAPYTTRLDNVETISVNPNGDIMVCCFAIGNINRESITDVLKRYDPYENPFMKTLLTDGARGLMDLAEAKGFKPDASQHFSACGLCREIVGKLVGA